MKTELKVKLLNKLKSAHPTLSEQECEDYFERATAYFLEYTNRREVPDKAFWLLLDMCFTLKREQDILFAPERKIAQIKEGDTTVEFEKEQSKALSSFHGTLNHYRVVMVR